MKFDKDTLENISAAHSQHMTNSDTIAEYEGYIARLKEENSVLSQQLFRLCGGSTVSKATPFTGEDSRVWIPVKAGKGDGYYLRESKTDQAERLDKANAEKRALEEKVRLLELRLSQPAQGYTVADAVAST